MAGLKGLHLFYLRPKHHYLMHLGQQVARTRINPRRVMSCFNDESFLGYLKRIGIKCHKATVGQRMLQRYALYLELRWRDRVASLKTLRG